MSSRDTDSNPPHDVERLLTPIRGNNPAGDDLRYLGLYDEIREARRSDETFEQGDWKRQPKLADWKKVVLLTTDALANHTKDLLVGAWFCEALVIVYGLTGLRDGLKLILGLHERFWENLYPEIDAGDTEARANVLSLMDRQLSLAITKASNQISGPQNEEVNELLNECRTEIRALERVIDEKYSGEAPGLPRLKKSLDNMVKLLDRQVKPKRVLEHEVEVAAESAWLDVIGSESAARSPARSTGAQTVCFTAYYPVELKPEVWYTLLVYVHVPAAIDAVHSDSQGRLGPRAKAHERSRAIATETIARGTEIVAVPEMRGCCFNPARASFLWLEDWHRIEFRMQASPQLSGFEHGGAANGRIAFYVGPLLVGEIKFWAHFVEPNNPSVSQRYDERTSAVYQSIFVSYSHEDRIIVDQLEKAYSVLGIEYLRDVRALRSGEEWSTALLSRIDKATIFQLCWSNAAKESKYVEQEWRHALELGRPAFIRPVYWEKPMPQPPSELERINFACLDFL